ncbi:MAG: ATP synthase F0 subunit B [Candidatus Kerfeldbacteria bacterium CG_4_10_14_0_8_um_filter_42_10]|uniref:ATP synthase subunit b n=1 Tax=Candidatus Kerfeldbacteria bacterium CG_4_10_14_0_8_um_filter_42_10 TaxID=2014248 RepID=A0A2M7RKG3_9BACT|nr:MAG: ATP synthase F0 subunit B [Candidatus Kerfeldbacteria bacterium CG_4_10_14_0_8_um_filter_42_10]
MDEVIKTFHIDWKLMIAQLINLAIVIFVLWKFAVKPLTKLMEKRSKDIEQSLKDAKKIEENLAKSEADKENQLKQARKEAQAIMEKANQQEERQSRQMIDETKTEVQTMIVTAKDQIAQEKQQMLKEAKADLGSLVIEATKKILEKTGAKEIDEKIVSDSLSHLSNKK